MSHQNDNTQSVIVDLAALGVSGTFQKIALDRNSLLGDTMRWRIWTDKERGWLSRDKDGTFSYTYDAPAGSLYV